VEFDFDKPPSFLTVVLIGAGAALLFCISCTCTVPFAGMVMGNRR
jgi:hypothetical protein